MSGQENICVLSEKKKTFPTNIPLLFYFVENLAGTNEVFFSVILRFSITQLQ